MKTEARRKVQHALQQYHVNKGANYNTKLSNPTKLIVKYDDDGCAWRCRATSILASKKWEIRKLHEAHKSSNPAISQDHANCKVTC